MTNIIFSLTYNGPKLGDGGTSALKAILQFIFAILGSISVIVIVIAGMRLSASRGNPDAIGKLRNTIIYAGIGLFVALLASAIVSFVIQSVQ